MRRPDWWLVACLIMVCAILAGYEKAWAKDIPPIVLHVIAAESANQSDRGMYLVAKTIVNRARIRGLTLEQVVRQRKQYSALNDTKWLKRWLQAHFDARTYQRANKAIFEALDTPGDSRITHYHTVDVMPYWARNHKAVIREGAHLFYADIK